MKSGSPGLICRAQTFQMLLAVLLVVPGIAAAQQPANPDLNNPPSALPAAQPLSQAAVSASSKQQDPAKPAKSDNAGKGDSRQSVKLGPGDLIDINVYNVPELASKVRVSNAGDVYLPLIDYVHVDGLTQEEAQAVIEKRLEDGGFVRNPHVTIFVDDASSQGVTILGEVNKPGIYPDTADRKLYEMISQAGGFTPGGIEEDFHHPAQPGGGGSFGTATQSGGRYDQEHRHSARRHDHGSARARLSMWLVMWEGRVGYSWITAS